MSMEDTRVIVAASVDYVVAAVTSIALSLTCGPEPVPSDVAHEALLRLAQDVPPEMWSLWIADAIVAVNTPRDTFGERRERVRYIATRAGAVIGVTLTVGPPKNAS